MKIVNANIVDVVNGDVLERKTIHIEKGIITNIDGSTPLVNEDVIDAAGKFVVPGIISCHTHLSVVFPFSDTDENESPAITAFRAATRAQQALASGITTIRCVHEQNKVDLFLKAAIKRGWSKAPRIFGAGRALSTPDGHGAGCLHHGRSSCEHVCGVGIHPRDVARRRPRDALVDAGARPRRGDGGEEDRTRRVVHARGAVRRQARRSPSSLVDSSSSLTITLSHPLKCALLDQKRNYPRGTVPKR